MELSSETFSHLARISRYLSENQIIRSQSTLPNSATLTMSSSNSPATSSLLPHNVGDQAASTLCMSSLSNGFSLCSPLATHTLQDTSTRRRATSMSESPSDLSSFEQPESSSLHKSSMALLALTPTKLPVSTVTNNICKAREATKYYVCLACLQRFHTPRDIETHHAQEHTHVQFQMLETTCPDVPIEHLRPPRFKQPCPTTNKSPKRCTKCENIFPDTDQLFQHIMDCADLHAPARPRSSVLEFMNPDLIATEKQCSNGRPARRAKTMFVKSLRMLGADRRHSDFSGKTKVMRTLNVEKKSTKGKLDNVQPPTTVGEKHMKRYVCTRCDKKFKYLRKLKKHQTLCGKPPIAANTAIRSEPMSVNRLTSEVKSPIRKQELFRPKRVAARKKLEMRLKGTSAGGKYQCDHCKREFAYYMNMLRHQNCCRDEASSSAEADDPGRSTIKLSARLASKSAIKEKSTRNEHFSCQKCLAEFESTDVFLAHKRTCKGLVIAKSSTKRAEAKKADKKEERKKEFASAFKCEACHRKFCYGVPWKKHLRTCTLLLERRRRKEEHPADGSHEDDGRSSDPESTWYQSIMKDYPCCPHCQTTFAYRENFRKHVETKVCVISRSFAKKRMSRTLNKDEDMSFQTAASTSVCSSTSVSRAVSPTAELISHSPMPDEQDLAFINDHQQHKASDHELRDTSQQAINENCMHRNDYEDMGNVLIACESMPSEGSNETLGSVSSAGSESTLVDATMAKLMSTHEQPSQMNGSVYDPNCSTPSDGEPNNTCEDSYTIASPSSHNSPVAPISPSSDIQDDEEGRDSQSSTPANIKQEDESSYIMSTSATEYSPMDMLEDGSSSSVSKKLWPFFQCPRCLQQFTYRTSYRKHVDANTCPDRNNGKVVRGRKPKTLLSRLAQANCIKPESAEFLAICNSKVKLIPVGEVALAKIKRSSTSSPQTRSTSSVLLPTSLEHQPVNQNEEMPMGVRRPRTPVPLDASIKQEPPSDDSNTECGTESDASSAQSRKKQVRPVGRPPKANSLLARRASSKGFSLLNRSGTSTPIQTAVVEEQVEEMNEEQASRAFMQNIRQKMMNLERKLKEVAEQEKRSQDTATSAP